MYKYLVTIFITTLFSCQKGVYHVERSSGINFDSGSTFAIIHNPKENREEAKLAKIVRKHMLQSGLVYDNEQPQFLVSLSFDESYSTIYVNILNAKTYQSIWQVRAFNNSDYKSDLQFERVAIAALQM